jgi:hypothetical protein
LEEGRWCAKLRPEAFLQERIPKKRNYNIKEPLKKPFISARRP